MRRTLIMLLVFFICSACVKQNKKEYTKFTEIGEGKLFVMERNMNMIRIESKRKYRRSLGAEKNASEFDKKKFRTISFYLIFYLQPYMTIENYKLAKEFENDINAKKRIVLKNQVHNYMNLRLPKFYSESGSYYLLDSSDWPTEEQDLAEIKKLIEYLKKNFTFYDEWPFLDQKVKI